MSRILVYVLHAECYEVIPIGATAAKKPAPVLFTWLLQLLYRCFMAFAEASKMTGCVGILDIRCRTANMRCNGVRHIMRDAFNKLYIRLDTFMKQAVINKFRLEPLAILTLYPFSGAKELHSGRAS